MDFDSMVDDSQQPQQQEPQSKPLMFDDLKEDQPSQPTEQSQGQYAPLKFDDMVDDSEKYSTPMEQAKTVAEGVGRGVSFGTSTKLEQMMGVPSENIIARQKANPGEAMTGEIAGNVALMAAAPEMEIAQLGKVGSAAIKTGIASGAFQTGDEVSNALLGQGNPLPVAAQNIAGMTGLGLLTGGAIKYGANKLVNAKLGTAMKSLLTGMGHAAQNPDLPVTSLSDALQENLPHAKDKLSNGAFRLGQYITKSKAIAIPSAIGYTVAGKTGAEFAPFIYQAVNKVVDPYVSAASKKYAAPMLMRMASNGFTDGLADVLDRANQIGKGQRAIESGVEGLFSSVPQKAYDYSTSDNEREKLKDFIEKGGTDSQVKQQQQIQEQQKTQQFAEGGEVKPIHELNNPDVMAENFPEHNMLMTAAKARVSNYLNSVRPLPNPAKLPFDTEQKDKHKDREYDKVLDLANQPLSVLKHIKDGTLLPKHVAALNAMYPELHEHLSKKLTERMLKGQVDEEKRPPYHVRQAMSLFLGASLDSTLTQPNMMAAQMVFANQKMQQQSAPPKKTGGLNKLAENAKTPQQGAEARLNKN